MGLYRKGTKNYDEYDWSIARQLNPLSPIPQSDLQDSPIAVNQERSKGKIYVGAVTGMLRRFTGTDHLYADGWKLYGVQELSDEEIHAHNLPTLEASFKSSGLPEFYRPIYVNDD